jgi:hypothetical protein
VPILDPKTLSLADLEAFDAHATERGEERRYCCPLGSAECQGKTVERSHQCLTVNTRTGLWGCHRCHQSGKLKEWWTERPKLEKGGRGRRRFTPRPSPVKALEPLPEAAPLELQTWREALQGMGPLTGSAGEAYLQARGIPRELATAAGVKFHPRLYGRPAVVFPIRTPKGELVAAQGRHTDGRTDPKTRGAGPKSAGVFITPGAWDAETIALVEAPIDALSLAACGLPAIALMGCALPGWIPRALHRKRVLAASDADQAGDTAAAEWKGTLEAYGAQVSRLRPEGAKDWNEWLTRDPEGMRAYLAPWLPGETVSACHSIGDQAKAGSNVAERYIADDQVKAGETVSGRYGLDDQPADDLGPLFESTMQEVCNLLGGADLEMWEAVAPFEAEMNEALAAGDLARLSVACGAYLDAARALHVPDPFEEQLTEVNAKNAREISQPFSDGSLFDLVLPEEPAAYGGLQGS